MNEPPTIFIEAQAALAPIITAAGLVEVRSAHHEPAFGSAFAEYAGAGRMFRLVWDGKEAALFGEVLIDGRWTDVESVTGKAPPFDRDLSSARVARLVRAASEALRQK